MGFTSPSHGSKEVDWRSKTETDIVKKEKLRQKISAQSCHPERQQKECTSDKFLLPFLMIALQRI